MADSERWSGLPRDVLSVIAKTLDSDVDIIRLRSVCSAWRSSVRGLYKPSSFPLRVPHLFSELLPELRNSGHYFLMCSKFYRASPPEYGPYAGDPCDAWLFRIWEVNPNIFSFLTPLLHGRSTHHLIPKSLNLLEHRISEICKCYSLDCVDVDSSEKLLVLAYTRKVVVLWNYAFDCEFVVLVLQPKGFMFYWKFGDRAWTLMNTNGYCCSDMTLCAGKCYLISNQGVLIFVDSELNLNVVPLTLVPVDCNECTFYLVEYKSDLYVVAKFGDEVKGNPDEADSTDEEDNANDEFHENFGSDEEYVKEIPLELKIFKKGTTNWEHITCLEDKVFVIGQCVSFGLSVKDFRGCKGNCVYLSPTHYYYPKRKRVDYAVYDLDERRTSVLVMAQGREIICAPPPKWLMSSSSSSH